MFDVHTAAAQEQWYTKDPALLQAEIDAMNKRFPKSRYGFYKKSGLMYWLVKVRLFQDAEAAPWVFQVVYSRDYSAIHGGSSGLKVVPIAPSFEELEKIAKAHGRPGLPHVMQGGTDTVVKRSLSIWWPDAEQACAVHAVAGAIDWAIHFTLGLSNKEIWDKWGYSHL